MKSIKTQFFMYNANCHFAVALGFVFGFEGRLYYETFLTAATIPAKSPFPDYPKLLHLKYFGCVIKV